MGIWRLLLKSCPDSCVSPGKFLPLWAALLFPTKQRGENP